jgi:hypothetical protein
MIPDYYRETDNPRGFVVARKGGRRERSELARAVESGDAANGSHLAACV